MRFSVGCISVVTKENIDLTEQYKYIKKFVGAIKFNPCFENSGSDYSVTSEEYATELFKLFLYWIKDKTAINLNPVENYIRSVMGIYTDRECTDGMCLGKMLDIDANGILRICSHSSQENFIIGHIHKFSSFSEIFNNNAFNIMVENMIKKREECRNKCELFGICQGGCCVSRMSETTFMCEVYRILYKKIYKYINRIISLNIDLRKYNPIFRHIIYEAISENSHSFIYQ